MKRLKFFFIVLASLASFSMAMAQSAEGLWLTLDDQSGKKRSLVRLTESDGVLNGTIVKIFKKKDDQGICAKCPGEFKNKPLEGLQFLWDLKKHGKNSWTDGKILDPKSGKIYRAKITIKGDKLFVRGYVGLSMMGRTQIWERQSQK